MKTKPNQKVRARLWLMCQVAKISHPLVWEMGRKFSVITNVGYAHVTAEIGIMRLEITGERLEVERAIRWVEQQGVFVEVLAIDPV